MVEILSEDTGRTDEHKNRGGREMSRTWRFSDIGWKVVWELAHDDALPAPLVFTSRIADDTEYRAEKRRIHERLRELNDTELDRVVAALGRPDIRITVDGKDARIPDNPRGCTRILACRRDDLAAVVTQLPGETIWHSGGFVLAGCHVLDLARTVAEALPDQPAGRISDVVLPVRADDEIDYEYGHSMVRTENDATAQRYRSFVQAGFTNAGTIEVIQARSRFGARGVTRHRIEWRDRCDDGRYVITPGTPAVAVPVDSHAVVALIDRLIAEVERAIQDEFR